MVTSLAADAARDFYAAGVACRASPALRMLRAACSSAGFPVLVPGQVFSREILTFIRDLDTPEIHGYQPDNEKPSRCAGPPMHLPTTDITRNRLNRRSPHSART